MYALAKAAEALGNVEWLYQGPTQADAAAQADIVRSFIQQGVDALIVAPNDPDSMAPLLQQAKDAGIHVARVEHLLGRYGDLVDEVLAQAGFTSAALLAPDAALLRRATLSHWPPRYSAGDAVQTMEGGTVSVTTVNTAGVLLLKTGFSALSA